MATDHTKKRKRDGHARDGAKEKKKKVTIEEPKKSAKEKKTAPKVRVTKVVQPQFAAPVIATAPGLTVTKDIGFESYAYTGRKSTKKSRPAPASAEMLLHSNAHHKVELTAREDNAPSAEALKHYVGIFDPKTNELQMVEVKKMTIRGSVRSREAPAEEMQGVPLKKTMMDLRNDLGQEFGTKKAKKAIVSLTENAIGKRTRNEDGTYQQAEMNDGDHALMETMEAFTSNMASREQLQEAVDNAKPIPKGNFNAAEIQDVYIPERIIGEDTLASIPVRDWQQAVKNSENIDTYSRFVSQRVNTIGMREDSLTHLRLLRYLYWLILYWGAARPGRDRGTKRQPPRDKMKEAMDGAPEAIIEHIRRHFTDNGTIRKFHADLIMTHCCVFACILDNFEMNTFDLREDLKLEKKQIAQYFSEIGAKIGQVKADGKVMQVAKLSLPLKFPDSSRQRRRR